MADADETFMRRALAQAELGRGHVEPNPLVGAVVVRNGTVVGEGFHTRFGGPHAEIVALDAAGAESRGAELYVTLEPCCHFGKTPPCTDRIIQSGVRRVIAAMQDPFPAVAGTGFDRLRHAGIEVQTGVGEAEARCINSPYLKLVSTGRPYVTAKWAMTLDGKISTASGESKWITGAEARHHSLEFRGLMDCIVVGIGTVVADDPLLTARPPGPKVPARIVVDSEGRTPFDSQLVMTAGAAPTLIAMTARAPQARIERFQRAGCECLITPATPRGRVDIGFLLDDLGRRRCTNVMIEGGAELLGSFFDAGMVDAVRVYLAGSVIGGDRAKSPVAGIGVDRLADRLQFVSWKSEQLGDDWMLSGSRPPVHP